MLVVLMFSSRDVSCVTIGGKRSMRCVMHRWRNRCRRQRPSRVLIAAVVVHERQQPLRPEIAPLCEADAVGNVDALQIGQALQVMCDRERDPRARAKRDAPKRGEPRDERADGAVAELRTVCNAKLDQIGERSQFDKAGVVGDVDVAEFERRQTGDVGDGGEALVGERRKRGEKETVEMRQRAEARDAAIGDIVELGAEREAPNARRVVDNEAEAGVGQKRGIAQIEPL